MLSEELIEALSAAGLPAVKNLALKP